MQSVVAMIGGPEIVGILVIVVVLFGANHIPGFFNGMKHGAHEFVQAGRQGQRALVGIWEVGPAENDGKAFRRYEISFWLIIVHVVAEMCSAALGWQ